MSRCVLIGGAGIRRYDLLRPRLREDDFIVCCDSGLKHREPLGVTADLIVGDFDSHENPRLSTETIVLPREKDDTDTFYAAKEMLARGFRDFWLIGVCGGRLDHTLGNLALLEYLTARGAKALATDDYSDLEIIPAGTAAVVEDVYPFFSLLNISGRAEGITIRGAKYPLSDADITCEFPYGISNEVLPGQRAEITLRAGSLLLIRILP